MKTWITSDLHFSHFIELCINTTKDYNMAKYQCVCVICKTPFLGSRPNVKTCSKECMGKNQSGTNNPNFGNKWTDEQRKAGSALKKEQL